MTDDDKMLVQLTVGELRQLIREELAHRTATRTTSRWVDVATTAEHFKCTPQTIRNWIRLGAPARQIGAASRPMFRIDLDAFEAWVRSYERDR